MLQLRPYEPAHAAALYALNLAAGQENWTHHPAETLPEVAGNPRRQAVTILEDGVPIGAFILSRDERVELYAGEALSDAITLNGLALDERCQGRGIGTAAMRLLPEFVPSVFPGTRQVLLCVHQTNHAAIHVYRKSGWHVLREREGKRGPLWVMCLQLDG